MIIKGIMSYPNLFVARKVSDDSEPKFGVNILVPKGDPQLAAIEKAIQGQVTEKLQGNLGNGRLCLKDCDVEYPDNPQLKGYMEIRCTAGAASRPHVVNFNDRQPVMDPAEVYPGAEAYFAIIIAGYKMPMSKGVTAYVNGVMITGKEGVLGRLDNRKSAKELFAEVGQVAPPVTPPVTPVTPVTPPVAPVTPPVAPVAPPVALRTMTVKAAGQSYESHIEAGWTDELLIQHGLMLPPGGVAPAFQ